MNNKDEQQLRNLDAEIDINNNELCYLDEIIIEGLTIDGVQFRPSDWVNRLCGMLASFERHKVSYSPFLRPMIYNDMQCVAIKKELQQKDPDVFNFIMQFATDNNLIVVDCAKFKQQAQLDAKQNKTKKLYNPYL